LQQRKTDIRMIRPISSFPQADYVAITPYLLPRGTAKKVNVGDGFILDSAIRLLGARPNVMLSSRAPLTDADIARVNASHFLIAVGANTLKDDFELSPGFDLATLRRLKVPVILMGVGHYGVPEVTQRLTTQSVELFRGMLDRFPYMSVRCEASRRYVLQSLPDKSDSILMTSCPVVHQVDDIDLRFVRSQHCDQLVVTLTDRAALEEQIVLLPTARQLFPAKRRILALHQDYQNAPLWNFAVEQGFEVFRGDTYEPFISLYAQTDLHIGNRLHAHLKCLSLGIASFLTPFDLRQVYFAESLDFPLVTNLPSPELAKYDFARAVACRVRARQTMDRFVLAVRALL
jgi:polysaccharide pyruvyl transferase